jgi:hypothetical protein
MRHEARGYPEDRSRGRTALRGKHSVKNWPALTRCGWPSRKGEGVERYSDSKWVKRYQGGEHVYVHGFTEVLDLLRDEDFQMREMFAIGFTLGAGRLIVETEERAKAAAAILEPEYEAVICRNEPLDDWMISYSRRNPDGPNRSYLIADLTLTDGTDAIKNGRVLT